MLKFADEADLEAAIARGDFTENHYCEAKRTLDGPSKANNKELARDLAQFALDGGVLVFGVEENKDDRHFSLKPFGIANGALERIEQVAATACQPPLPVVPRFVDSADTDGGGYIVVEVPVSPHAPHMVDGKYLGRGETQKRYLTDTEVRSILTGRQRELGRAQVVQDELIAQDPLGDVGDRNVHFFAVALPLGPIVGDLEADREVVQDAYFGAKKFVRNEHMLSTYPTTFRAIAIGGTLRSQSLVDGVDTSDAQRFRVSVLDQSAEFGVRHDGGVWCYHSRASKLVEPGGRMLFPDQVEDGARMVLGAAAGWAKRFTYRGSWSVGVALTGLAGSKPYRQEIWGTEHPLTDETYFRFTRTTTAEMTTEVDEVARRLVSRFLAMCGR